MVGVSAPDWRASHALVETVVPGDFPGLCGYVLQETPFSWRCPFCDQNATITDETFDQEMHFLTIGNTLGKVSMVSEFTVCPNPRCNKFGLAVGLHPFSYDGGRPRVGPKPFQVWQLVPESNAKVFPDYIQEAVRADYRESCRIRSLSPKAAATLARRCLQGMIRDFWDVTKHNLKAEIDTIESKVDPLTWKAIDGVRTVGNIGAHMEKDIDLIVEVEPQEAEMLIELVETLVADWYIARHDREERLKAVVAMAERKEEQRKNEAGDAVTTTNPVEGETVEGGHRISGR